METSCPAIPGVDRVIVLARFWRIRSFLHGIVNAYYCASFSRQCQSVGDKLLVNGPFRIRSTGQIPIGSACIFDSSRERPIRLDVGYRAIFQLGNGTYVNEGVHIVCNISVSIGNKCLIAPDVEIIDDDGHPVDWHERHNHWPENPEDRFGAPIVIGNNVWIGTRAIILKGVTIGSGSVIGAGAVVTKSVPVASLVAGVPARVIRNLE